LPLWQRDFIDAAIAVGAVTSVQCGGLRGSLAIRGYPGAARATRSHTCISLRSFGGLCRSAPIVSSNRIWVLLQLTHYPDASGLPASDGRKLDGDGPCSNSQSMPYLPLHYLVVAWCWLWGRSARPRSKSPQLPARQVPQLQSRETSSRQPRQSSRARSIAINSLLASAGGAPKGCP
jgi:hypothetical protein